MRRKAVSHLALGAVLMFQVSLCSSIAATNQFTTVNSGFSAYVINGVSNPDLKLVRGFTYTFEVNATGHPFWIKTVQGTGTGNAYNDGVSGNGTQSGAVTLAVPTNAPSLLYYNCQFHAGMTGELHIEDPPTVFLTDFTIATNLVLKSTGTDALNVSVSVATDLVVEDWLPATVLSNVHANGTNTTTVAPTGPVLFLQVEQGLP